MNLTPHLTRLLVIPIALAVGLLGHFPATASAAETHPAPLPPVQQQFAVHGHWTTFTLELYPSDQRALIAGLRSGGVGAVGAVLCVRAGAKAAAMCALGLQTLGGVVASEITDHYHPRCHLNISIRYNGLFDRWWTSDCK